MDFGKKPAQRRRKLKLDGHGDISSYPHNLQFYAQPPTENITLQEFEDFAVDRLRVLKAVDTVGVRHIKGSEEYKDAMKNELKKLGVMKAFLKKHSEDIGRDDYDERRKDHLSHFILRLAYCRSEELRRWLITQEVDLFRYRFCEESDESITTFLMRNNLKYEPISKKEKLEVLKELIACRQLPARPADITNYYKVPFTEALDLVRGRRVFLKKGFAYVPHNELVVIILSVFRSNLSHALAMTSRVVPQLEEDNRLLPMLSNLSKRYLGQDYSNKKPSAGQVTADMIDMLSKKSFPLCMQQLHQGLRSSHHLKHWGRMQYGLFLKAIGLSLDEAVKFWRAEFTKVMDPDKFDKQYAYNLRHNYGKEGKRTDYTPYSCVKIITTNHPATGDHHGCPFKHMDADLLRQRLHSLRISKEGTDDIIENVKSSNYQVACARYFELTNNAPRDTFHVNHPNQYYEEGQKLLATEKDDDASATKRSGNVTVVKSQKSSQSSQSQNELSLTPDQMNSIFDEEMN